MKGARDAPRILVLFGNIPLHGQERGNIEALDALRSTGCEVLFLIRREWTKDTIQVELNRRGLRWVAVPYFAAVRKGLGLGTWARNLCGILGGSWQLLRLIRSFRATHIHTGSQAHVLNFLPALALTRLPVIYRCGDVPMEHHALWRWVWAYTRTRTHHFVAISQFIRSELEARGVQKSRITVIYNAPPTRTSGEPVKLPVSSDGGMMFLYVGQLTAEKGLAELIEAAIGHCRRHPSSRFLLAGDYSWNNPFATGLMRRVEQERLSDRIVFLGFVSAVYDLFRHAQVHVCPSLWKEPLGNVVVEAKHTGVPSVVFPSGGLPELIEDGVDGWICAEKTAAALVDAFAAYEADPGLALRQGEAARRSLARLGMDTFAERWRAVYEGTRPVRSRQTAWESGTGDA